MIMSVAVPLMEVSECWNVTSTVVVEDGVNCADSAALPTVTATEVMFDVVF